MKINFPLPLPAASPAGFSFASPTRRRLLLGLTARHLRTGATGAAPVRFGSSSPFGSSVLDRLQPTLTRYHE